MSTITGLCTYLITDTGLQGLKPNHVNYTYKKSTDTLHKAVWVQSLHWTVCEIWSLGFVLYRGSNSFCSVSYRAAWWKMHVNFVGRILHIFKMRRAALHYRQTHMHFIVHVILNSQGSDTQLPWLPRKKSRVPFSLSWTVSQYNGATRLNSCG